MNSYFVEKGGIPDYDSIDFVQKRSDFALLIPVVNEGVRIQKLYMTSQKSIIHD
jgi:phosphorylcholine metabolism protein LicD